MRTLGVPHQVAEAFLTDILGKQHGSTYIEGLVDCRSEQEFDEKLQALEQTWNDRELPYCPSSGPRFYNSFCTYQAEVIKHHMRRDVREAVGLGCPPSVFTTNRSQSLNASINTIFSTWTISTAQCESILCQIHCRQHKSLPGLQRESENDS